MKTDTTRIKKIETIKKLLNGKLKIDDVRRPSGDTIVLKFTQPYIYYKSLKTDKVYTEEQFEQSIKKNHFFMLIEIRPGHENLEELLKKL